MSTKVLRSLVDDIDGTEAEGTVRFGLDGQAYEIDLNAAHAGDLRDGLSKYVAAARPAAVNGSAPKRPGRGRPAGRPAAKGGRTPAAPPAALFVPATAGPDRLNAVRSWARGPGAAEVAAAGIDPVAERGRLAVRVYELYDARPRP